jgi:hypothetical protein
MSAHERAVVGEVDGDGSRDGLEGDAEVDEALVDGPGDGSPEVQAATTPTAAATATAVARATMEAGRRGETSASARTA